MRRLIGVVVLFFVALPALCETTSNYQIATITDVKPHGGSQDPSAEATSYDVSVRVGETMYVVLYTTPMGDLAPKYVAGRQMLVLVGKDAITYNDLLGRSLQVPIESQRPVIEPKQAKFQR